MNGPQSLSELHELASQPNDGVLNTLRSVDGNVLVLGAGGKMGFHLSLMIKRGLDRLAVDHNVIACSRFANPAMKECFEQHGIQTMVADLQDTSVLDSLPDASAVFFLAGVKFGTQHDPQLLHQANVELPSRVAQRFQGSRIVALSTGCVYPFVPIDSGGCTESDSVHPVGQYAESCVGRERSFIDSKARVSLIRLNYSVDLRYGVLVDVAQNVLADKPVDVRTSHFNVIWQGDANRYIIQALAHAASPAFVLNVSGVQALSVRQVANRFAKMYGIGVQFTGQESDTAWLSNASRSHQLFGPPSVTEDQLIQWVGEWLTRGGQTLDRPTRFEVRDGQF